METAQHYRKTQSRKRSQGYTHHTNTGGNKADGELDIGQRTEQQGNTGFRRSTGCELENTKSSNHGSEEASHTDNKEMEDGETDEGIKNKNKSVITEEKECNIPPPKSTYLDAVLQGNFNSFHVLGDHQESVMMREWVNVSDDASQDTFQWTGSTG